MGDVEFVKQMLWEDDRIDNRRNSFGSMTHFHLVSYARDRLKKMGYKVSTEEPLGNYRIDIYGRALDKKTIGVECLTNICPSLIRKKYSKYKPYLDKLIFCSFAKNKNYKFWKHLPKDIEIWELGYAL